MKYRNNTKNRIKYLLVFYSVLSTSITLALITRMLTTALDNLISFGITKNQDHSTSPVFCDIT